MVTWVEREWVLSKSDVEVGMTEPRLATGVDDYLSAGRVTQDRVLNHTVVAWRNDYHPLRTKHHPAVSTYVSHHAAQAISPNTKQFNTIHVCHQSDIQTYTLHNVCVF